MTIRRDIIQGRVVFKKIACVRTVLLYNRMVIAKQ